MHHAYRFDAIFAIRPQPVFNRLRVNAAIFRNDIDDNQFFEFFAGPFGLMRVVTTIDQAKVSGFEADFACDDAPWTGIQPTAPSWQIDGEPATICSDLYSLACVGFYALSGQVPFTHESAAETLVKHIGEPPPPLLTLAPHSPPASPRTISSAVAELRPPTTGVPVPGAKPGSRQSMSKVR